MCHWSYSVSDVLVVLTSPGGIGQFSVVLIGTTIPVAPLVYDYPGWSFSMAILIGGCSLVQLSWLVLCYNYPGWSFGWYDYPDWSIGTTIMIGGWSLVQLFWLVLLYGTPDWWVLIDTAILIGQLVWLSWLVHWYNYHDSGAAILVSPFVRQSWLVGAHWYGYPHWSFGMAILIGGYNYPGWCFGAAILIGLLVWLSWLVHWCGNRDWWVLSGTTVLIGRWWRQQSQRIGRHAAADDDNAWLIVTLGRSSRVAWQCDINAVIDNSSSYLSRCFYFYQHDDNCSVCGEWNACDARLMCCGIWQWCRLVLHTMGMLMNDNTVNGYWNVLNSIEHQSRHCSQSFLG